MFFQSYVYIVKILRVHVCVCESILGTRVECYSVSLQDLPKYCEVDVHVNVTVLSPELDPGRA